MLQRADKEEEDEDELRPLCRGRSRNHLMGLDDGVSRRGRLDE